MWLENTQISDLIHSLSLFLPFVTWSDPITGCSMNLLSLSSWLSIFDSLPVSTSSMLALELWARVISLRLYRLLGTVSQNKNSKKSYKRKVSTARNSRESRFEKQFCTKVVNIHHFGTAGTLIWNHTLKKKTQPTKQTNKKHVCHRIKRQKPLTLRANSSFKFRFFFYHAINSLCVSTARLINVSCVYVHVCACEWGPGNSLGCCSSGATMLVYMDLCHFTDGTVLPRLLCYKFVCLTKLHAVRTSTSNFLDFHLIYSGNLSISTYDADCENQIYEFSKPRNIKTQVWLLFL